MELFELILAIIVAVMISSALEPFLPRVSLPLVQILVGVGLFFFTEMPSSIVSSAFESDFFLVFFIAPLLFDESRNANNRALWENKRSIVSLAVGLVLLLVLVTGFTLHLIVPSVGLAAAFALGAALGPTDAVAVASLGKEIKLNTRQKALLSGEALLNDASGVVSFQFAIAAAVTGAFSLQDATLTFAIEFFGGIGFGILFGVLAVFVVSQIRKLGVESVTTHVCFEIVLPFLVYLLAHQIHVSGILAVVAAGLVFSLLPQTALFSRAGGMSTFSSKLSLASENVWDLISFLLNGIIFTLLGYLLPSTIQPALQENSTDIFTLIGLVLILTAVVEGVRFIWIVVMDLLSSNPETGKRFKPNADFWKNSIVTTLSGPKGAVSLSIAMTIPSVISGGDPFPQRDLLMFLICGVIITTLSLANFVVPVLAPKPDSSADLEPDIEIRMLENVVSELKKHKTPQNKKAIFETIRTYQKRIAQIKRTNVSGRDLRFLRQEILVQQEAHIKQAISQDIVDRRKGESYLRRIARMKKMLSRSTKSFVGTSAMQNRPLANSTTVMRKITSKMTERKNSKRARLEFKIGIEQVAVEYLNEVTKEEDASRACAADALLSEHAPLLAALRAQLSILNKSEGVASDAIGETDTTYFVRTETGSLRKEEADASEEIDGLAEVQALGLSIELDEVLNMREQRLISSNTAREMREEIYLLQMGLDD